MVHRLVRALVARGHEVDRRAAVPHPLRRRRGEAAVLDCDIADRETALFDRRRDALADDVDELALFDRDIAQVLTVRDDLDAVIEVFKCDVPDHDVAALYERAGALPVTGDHAALPVDDELLRGRIRGRRERCRELLQVPDDDRFPVLHAVLLKR